MTRQRIGPEERLRVTLLFSAILHAIVILGVTFDYEDPAAYLPSLDVILVQSAAATKPDKADFLANASQQGGGESDESKRPRQPVTSPIPKATDGLAPMPQRASAPKPQKATPQPVLRGAADEYQVQRVDEARPETPGVPQVSGRELMEHSLEMAKLAAELERQTEAYAKRPKRKFISASTKEYVYANYLRAWVDRAERVSNLNELDDIAEPFYIDLQWKAPANWSDEEAYFFGQGQMLVPPQSGRWGLKGSFDGDFAGLAPRAYSRLSDLVIASNPLNPRWLQVGGVTHVLRFAAEEDPSMEVVARVDTLHEQDLLVLRVPEPRPHAYFASRVRVVDSEDDAVRVLGAADFDLADEIVRVKEAGPSGNATPDGAPGAALLRVEEMIDGRTAMRVKLEAPRTLVVLDAISGGWSALVHGQPAVVRPANLIFQSVDLPAGEHLVELEYQTPGLAAGVGISVLAWLSLLVRAGPSQPPARRRRDLASENDALGEGQVL